MYGSSANRLTQGVALLVILPNLVLHVATFAVNTESYGILRSWSILLTPPGFILLISGSFVRTQRRQPKNAIVQDHEKRKARWLFIAAITALIVYAGWWLYLGQTTWSFEFGSIISTRFWSAMMIVF